MYDSTEFHLVEGYKCHCLQHHAQWQLLSILETYSPCADQLCHSCQPASILSYVSILFLFAACSNTAIHGGAGIDDLIANVPGDAVLEMIFEVGVVEVDGEVVAGVLALAVIEIGFIQESCTICCIAGHT